MIVFIKLNTTELGKIQMPILFELVSDNYCMMRERAYDLQGLNCNKLCEVT